jgi:hypothetical protein
MLGKRVDDLAWRFSPARESRSSLRERSRQRLT